MSRFICLNQLVLAENSCVHDISNTWLERNKKKKKIKTFCKQKKENASGFPKALIKPQLEISNSVYVMIQTNPITK